MRSKEGKKKKTGRETYRRRVEENLEYKQAKNKEQINHQQQTDQEYQGDLCVVKEKG